jgi:hypothetical protein
MIDMITTALDIAIMTGIVMFIAAGLTLRHDVRHAGTRTVDRSSSRCIDHATSRPMGFMSTRP